jgi:hypothetical protein
LPRPCGARYDTYSSLLTISSVMSSYCAAPSR